MNKTFRTLKAEEKEEAMALWGYAFGKEEPYYSGFFETVFSPQNTLGLFCDGELATVGFVIPQKVRVRGKVLHSAFLVGITTRANLRGTGCFKEWMNGTIKHLENEGYDLAMLVPFETSFYKPYGFETCYTAQNWSVPLANLPIAHGGEFQEVSDISEIADIYEAFAKNYHGSVVRDALDWAHVKLEMVSENAHAIKLSDHMGYGIYTIRDNTLQVIEWAYLNPLAKKQLLSFFRSHIGQVTKVNFSAPADDSLIYSINDQIFPTEGNQVVLRPYQSVRVLNPKKLMEKLGIWADISGFTIGEISQMVMGVYDGAMDEKLRDVFDRKVNYMRENFM